MENKKINFLTEWVKKWETNYTEYEHLMREIESKESIAEMDDETLAIYTALKSHNVNLLNLIKATRESIYSLKIQQQIRMN